MPEVLGTCGWHALCSRRSHAFSQEGFMLSWVFVFFIAALVAAFLGFSGLAASMAGIAKILFFVFIVLAVVSFAFGRRAPM
jgi:uncharacterized membrane protein YtjA (UPF0391 family)